MAKARQLKRERQQSLWASYHLARLIRAKQMPSLTKLIDSLEGNDTAPPIRKQSAKEIEAIFRSYHEQWNRKRGSLSSNRLS